MIKVIRDSIVQIGNRNLYIKEVIDNEQPEFTSSLNSPFKVLSSDQTGSVTLGNLRNIIQYELGNNKIGTNIKLSSLLDITDKCSVELDKRNMMMLFIDIEQIAQFFYEIESALTHEGYLK